MMNRLYDWSVKCNLDPTNPADEIIFTNGNLTAYKAVPYSDMVVTIVVYYRHLVLTLDIMMNYMKHIDVKIYKANQGIGIIRR